jgi:hypothetical protein
MTKMNFSLSSFMRRAGKPSLLTLVVFGFSLFAFSFSASAQDRTGGAQLKPAAQAEQIAGAFAKAIVNSLPAKTTYALPVAAKTTSSNVNPEQIAGVILAEEFTRKIWDLNGNSTLAFNAAVNELLAQAPDNGKQILRAASNLLNALRQ